MNAVLENETTEQIPVLNSAAAVEYVNYIQRDGILKLNKTPLKNTFLTSKKCGRAVAQRKISPVRKNTDSNGVNISQLALNEAQIWATPVTAKKICIQWHLPTGMRRNCLEIFDSGKNYFVLRIYQNFPTPSGWKKSQRTLEFEIDISRRCCYINLENVSGMYIAELGLHCSDSRYIFIARSAEVKMPSVSASVTKTIKPAEKEKNIDHNEWEHEQVSPYKSDVFAFIDEEGNPEKHDVVSEKNSVLVYNDFLNEGKKYLKNKKNVTISREKLVKQKVIFAKAKTAADSKKNVVKKLVNSLNANAETVSYSINKFQLVTKETLSASPKKNKETVKKDLNFPKSFSWQPLVISSAALKDKISRLKDKSEIILRGKIKKLGQRVRVGGLLIEPEEDGTFCVACCIRNKKLYVPVEEVNASCIK